MIYSNLISPRFVGDSTVRCMLTFHTASCRNCEFRKFHFVLVEHRQFQSIRVEFLTLEGYTSPLRTARRPQCGASFPQKLPVGIFAIQHCISIPPNTIIAMQPLVVYYLNQTGRGLTHSGRSALSMQPSLPTAWARHRQFFRQFLSVGRTRTVARDQSCGSQHDAYRRQDPNRHCREQFTHIVPQGYRV